MLPSRFTSLRNVASRLKLNFTATLGAALLIGAGGLSASAQTTTSFTSSGNLSSPVISITGSCSSTIPVSGCSTSGTYGKGGYGFSTISVPDAGTVTKVQVTLNGLTSSGWDGNEPPPQSDSIGFASVYLVSPGGQKFELLGCTGDSLDGDDSGTSSSGLDQVNITLVDTASSGAPLGTPWQHTGSTTIKPSSYWTNGNAFCGGAAIPANAEGLTLAQTDSSATLNSTFANGPSNGNWTLYIDNYDTFLTEAANDPIELGSWTLTLTYTATVSASTTTTISSNANPANSGNAVTYTADVSSSGGTVSVGSVTFTSNLSNANCTQGNPVAVSGGVASCTVTLTQGLYSISASYGGGTGFNSSSTSQNLNELVEGITSSGGTDTFCNTGSIPLSDGSTTIYPSIIKVTGFSGQTVSNVEVKLLDVTGKVTGSHLLVSPDGLHNLDFLDNGFNESDSTTGAWMDFYDTAGAYPNTTGVTGPPVNSSGSPANYVASDEDSLETPFPSSGAHTIDSAVPQVPGTIHYGYNNVNPSETFGPVTETFGSNFSGATADGDWALYPYENFGDNENLSGGWCVALTVNTGVATTTSVTSTQNPQVTGQTATLTATVTAGGNPVSSGTVTFLENGVAPPGTVSGDNVVTLNGSGQAAFTTAALPEGDSLFVVEYGGTSSDNASQTTFTQRANNNTTLYANGATISHGPACSGTYCYCNAGTVSTNSSFKGAFTPNPSIIDVTNLPGTISSVSLGLNQYSSASSILYALESMVVNPTGTDLDFFSNAGGTSFSNLGGTASLGNYIFSDSAINAVPDSNSTLSPGTYKPSSFLEEDSNWPEPAQPYTASTSGFYTLPSGITYAANRGSGTFSSQFGNTNPDGNWALYMTEDDPAGVASAANGWCVNFTVNPVTVSADLGHQGDGTGTDFVQGESDAQISLTVSTSNSTGATGDPTHGSNPLTVTDTLPAGLTYVGFSGTNWSCSSSSQTVTCSNDASIAQNASYPTLTLGVNVATNSATPLTNRVNTSGAGTSPLTNISDTITVDPTPVLSVAKSHSGNFISGTTGVWTITVSNTAAGSATSGTVNVADTLPSGYTFVSSTSSGNLWNCSGSGTVSCSATPGIAGGSGSTINLTVNVPSNSPTVVTNTALAWGGGDTVHTSQGTAATSNTDSVTVDAASVITSGSSTTFAVGTEGVFPVTTTGNPTPALSESGALPNGVTFVDNGNGSASLSGVPSFGSGGIYPFTISATNGVGTSATQSFTLTVDQAPAITSGSSTTFGTGAAGSFTVTTAAFPVPSLSESGSLPNGVTFTDNLNGTATLAGTPALGSAGTYPLNITASNGVAPDATQSFTLTVNPPSAYVVTTNTDDVNGTPSNCPTPSSGNTCTLRDALAAAAAAGSGIITFDSTAFATAQTITLANGTLNVPGDTSITGATSGSGASLTNLVTVNGSNASTVFTEGSGVTGDSINGLIITAGSSGTSGGGVSNGGTLTISNSTIVGNSANGGFGGGIANTGTLTLNSSTISGNSATTGQGSGIFNSGALTLTDSTIAGNTAAGGIGGGIMNAGGGTLTITNSTISGNSATGGGGIYGVGTTVNLANSIVSGNPADADIDGAFNDNGGNQVSVSAINLTQIGNYGGPTQTMIPLPGSPAICFGTLTNWNTASLTADQRGDPQDPNCPAGSVDSGAVQTNYAIGFTTQPPSNALVDIALNPAPVVSLTESSAPISVNAGTVAMTDTASQLTGTLSEAISAGAATFNNLVFPNPTTGDILNATLALTSSINLTAQATTAITVAEGQPATLTPSSGTLATSQTFTWGNGVGATEYFLTLGTLGPGSSNVFSTNDTTATTATVTIPANAVTVYATFSQFINGAWQVTTYTFTEPGTPMPATLTPSSGTLSTSQRFTWNNGVGSTLYLLALGTSGYGSTDLLSTGDTKATTVQVKIPSTGATVYATFWQLFGGAWQKSEYTFTEPGSPTPATLTPSSGILATSQTFNWSNGLGVREYSLSLGTKGFGSNDLLSTGDTTATMATVSIPSNGATVYATFWQLINGAWQKSQYTFTESAAVTAASLSPSSGTLSTSQTFTWSNGVGPTKYSLSLGTKGFGSSDLLNTGDTTATMATVSIPSNSATVYATFWQFVNGAWEKTEYSFTEPSPGD